MPGISKATEELKRIQTEADLATAKVNQLRQKLVDTIAVSTRGGTPTQTGISRVASQLEQSGGLMNRQRVGGNAKLASDPATISAVNSAILELVNEKLKLTILQLKQESLSKASAGNVKTDFTKFAAETDTILNTIETTAVKRIEQIKINAKLAADKLNSYADKPGEDAYTKFSSETDKILSGLESQATAEISRIQKLQKEGTKSVVDELITADVESIKKERTEFKSVVDKLIADDLQSMTQIRTRLSQAGAFGQVGVQQAVPIPTQGANVGQTRASTAPNVEHLLETARNLEKALTGEIIAGVEKSLSSQQRGIFNAGGQGVTVSGVMQSALNSGKVDKSVDVDLAGDGLQKVITTLDDVAVARIQSLVEQIKTIITQLGINPTIAADTPLVSQLKAALQVKQTAGTSTGPFANPASPNAAYTPPPPQAAAKDPEWTSLDTFEMQLRKQYSKLPEETIQSIMDKVREATSVLTSYGETINTVKARIRSFTGEYANLEVAIATNGDSIKKLNMVLDRQGNVYDKMPKATDDKSMSVKGTLDEATARRLEEIVATETVAYTNLGATVDITDLAMKRLDDDTMQYTATATTSVGAVEKVNTVLDKNGNLLTEQEYKTRKAREEYEKFQRAMTAQIDATRLRSVEKEAKRGGFNMDQLTDVRTQQPSGVSFFKFKEDVDGVSKYMEVAVGPMGNVLNRTNRALLSFTDSIKRNISELFKWSLGIGLVYGSYYKLQEIIQISMDTQAKLVDVTVSMGDTTTSLTTIFKELASVAAATGESINEVANSYVYAYRAVGSARNEIERTAAANQLLTDATILNKLSNMDAADSIDTLSGALRQIAEPGETAAQTFARGQELLDKWVVTTRSANVDMATLAQAFSVTAESAKNSGVGIEELNAIIASLSEKIGGLGGKETGNAVRALIGGVYQQQAVAGLSQYGIAVEDSTGKMRDFMDISQDIYDLYQEGIIDSTELNKIGYTLGGGVRRGQQYVAYLSDFGKIQDITTKQTNYNGAAQEALATKMDTVQTSSTELSNSFQALAFTLGNEGGVLGATTAVMDVMTGLTNVITGLNETLGKLAVPAALITILGLYTKLGGASAQMGLMAGQQQLGARITSGLAGKMFGLGNPIGKGLGGFVGSGGLMATAAMLPALSRFGESTSNEKGDVEKGLYNKAAWASVGFTLAGAVAGGFMGNPLIGATVGSAIGEGFISTVMDYKSEFAGFFFDPGKPKTPDTGDKFQDYGKQLQDQFEQNLYKIIGGGGDSPLKNGEKFERAVGVARSDIETALNNMIVGVADFFGKDVGQQMTRQQMAQAILSREGKYTPELQQQYNTASAYAPESQPYETSIFSQQQRKVQVGYQDYLKIFEEQQREQLRSQLISGEIKPKQYTEAKNEISTLSVQVTKLFTALNRGKGGFTEFSDVGKKEMTDLSKIIIRSSEEDMSSINTLVTEIIGLSRILDAGIPADPESLEAYNVALEESATKVNKLREYLDALRVAQAKELASKITLPEVFQTENLDNSSVRKMIEDAKKLQADRFSFLSEKGLLTSEEADALISQAEPILIYMGEQMGYYLAEGITSSEFLSDALKQTNIPYDFMDVTQSQMQSIMPQYDALRKQIVDKGGESTETGLLTFFKDSTSPVYMEKDWKLVQYLLQQILDVNEEQLDGMYNLPSGASFYVPFQAYKMHTDTAESLASQTSSLDTGEFDSATTVFSMAVDRFTESVIARGREGGLIGARLNEPGAREALASQLNTVKNKADSAYALASAATQQEWTDNTRDSGREGGLLGERLGENKSTSLQETSPYGWAIPGGDPEMQAKFNQFFSWLDSLFSLPNPGEDTPMMDTTTPTAAPTIQTQLTLDSNTQVQLVVDGQVLAEAIAPYLATKLVSYESSGGSTARGFTSIG